VRAAFADAFGRPPAEYVRLTTPYTLGPGWPEANPERYAEILAGWLERPTPYETIAAHVDACYRFYDEGCAVESIDVPALVVHGECDRIVPVENGRRLAERLPRAEYVELPGRGHNLMLEDPEAFAALACDFLERAG
jgi:pimeloyl-ACP methyl ester carboxylesterase